MSRPFPGLPCIHCCCSLHQPGHARHRPPNLLPHLPTPVYYRRRELVYIGPFLACLVHAVVARYFSLGTQNTNRWFRHKRAADWMLAAWPAALGGWQNGRRWSGRRHPLWVGDRRTPTPAKHRPVRGLFNAFLACIARCLLLLTTMAFAGYCAPPTAFVSPASLPLTLLHVPSVSEAVRRTSPRPTASKLQSSSPWPSSRLLTIRPKSPNCSPGCRLGCPRALPWVRRRPRARPPRVAPLCGPCHPRSRATTKWSDLPCRVPCPRSVRR